jgi:ribosomal protein S18 acetylase RimI-like enzyme
MELSAVSDQKGGPMNEENIKIRLMKADDFDAIVGIDKKILGTPRLDFFDLKFEKLFNSREFLPISLVAETEGGAVVGFVMGELFMSEDGMVPNEATLDTIGVDPDFQRKSIGRELINEFMNHLKKLGVQKLNTLVDSTDFKMLHFFRDSRFSPAQTVNLERKL